MSTIHTHGVLPELTALAAQTRASLRAQVEAEQAAADLVRREREAAERAGAEAAAQDLAAYGFPGTLAHVVSAEMWRGYPGASSSPWAKTMPSAVAYLGASTFLHYTETPDDDCVMTLLQPCTSCGARMEHRLWDDIELSACLGSKDHPKLCQGCALDLFA